MKKMNIYFKILTLSLLFSFTDIVVARETDSIPLHDTIKSKILDEIVITANRYESLPLKTPEPIRVP